MCCKIFTEVKVLMYCMCITYFHSAFHLNVVHNRYDIGTSNLLGCWNIRVHIHAPGDLNIYHTLQKSVIGLKYICRSIMKRSV